MDTLTYKSKRYGYVCAVAPFACVGALIEYDDEKKTITYVFINKTAADESTYAARQRAMDELGVLRSDIEFCSFYKAGFTKAANAKPYSVFVLADLGNGYLQPDPSRTSSDLSDGKSVETAESLIHQMLGVDVNIARKKKADAQAEKVERQQKASPVSVESQKDAEPRRRSRVKK